MRRLLGNGRHGCQSLEHGCERFDGSLQLGQPGSNLVVLSYRWERRDGLAYRAVKRIDRRVQCGPERIGCRQQMPDRVQQGAMSLLDRRFEPLGELERRFRYAVVSCRDRRSCLAQLDRTAKKRYFQGFGWHLRDRVDQWLGRDVESNPAEDREKYQSGEDQNSRDRRDHTQGGRCRPMILRQPQPCDRAEHDQGAEKMAASHPKIMQASNLAPCRDRMAPRREQDCWVLSRGLGRVANEPWGEPLQSDRTERRRPVVVVAHSM